MEHTRRHRNAVPLLLAGCFAMGLMTATPRVQAASGSGIANLIKVFGMAWVVDNFSGRINRAINGALRQHQAQVEGATKVVPIVRVGVHSGGAAVGAAQVMGPAQQVEQVEAVAEIELGLPGAIRARGLIPISARDASSINSVGGVGVSADIKFRL